MKKNQTILMISVLSGLALLWWFAPITQAQSYHDFAEQRHIMGIQHFGDVLSNMAFVFAGIYLMAQEEGKALYRGQKGLYVWYCFGSICLGLGSAYYHWAPDDSTLVVDRATMLLGFSVIFLDSMIRFGVISPNRLFIKALTLTFLFQGTAIFWMVTGRLEPYVFAQFFTMFALIFLAWGREDSRHVVAMCAWYALAKLFESSDSQVFEMTNEIISGHTLKHLAYGVALIAFGRGMLVSRSSIACSMGETVGQR